MSDSKLIIKVAKNQFAVSAVIVCIRILFLFTYAEIEYVSARTYLSENRIRTLRILEPWLGYGLVQLVDVTVYSRRILLIFLPVVRIPLIRPIHTSVGRYQWRSHCECRGRPDTAKS